MGWVQGGRERVGGEAGQVWAWVELGSGSGARLLVPEAAMMEGGSGSRRRCRADGASARLPECAQMPHREKAFTPEYDPTHCSHQPPPATTQAATPLNPQPA